MEPIRNSLVVLPDVIESLNSIDSTLFDVHTSIMENGGYLLNISDNFDIFSTAVLSELSNLELALSEIETSVYQTAETYRK